MFNRVDKVYGPCLGDCGRTVLYGRPDKDTVLDKLCDECFMEAKVTFPAKVELKEAKG